MFHKMYSTKLIYNTVHKIMRYRYLSSTNEIFFPRHQLFYVITVNMYRKMLYFSKIWQYYKYVNKRLIFHLFALQSLTKVPIECKIDLISFYHVDHMIKIMRWWCLVITNRDWEFQMPRNRDIVFNFSCGVLL